MNAARNGLLRTLWPSPSLPLQIWQRGTEGPRQRLTTTVRQQGRNSRNEKDDFDPRSCSSRLEYTRYSRFQGYEGPQRGARPADAQRAYVGNSARKLFQCTRPEDDPGTHPWRHSHEESATSEPVADDRSGAAPRQRAASSRPGCLPSVNRPSRKLSTSRSSGAAHGEKLLDGRVRAERGRSISYSWNRRPNAISQGRPTAHHNVLCLRRTNARARLDAMLVRNSARSVEGRPARRTAGLCVGSSFQCRLES
jgi:hypothetical protein